ncbi:hypothetical protein QQP08_020177 [Theobroma cacao]|nr:hypothetical protein QQP08_020177 [Theobroma cacao]
MEYVLAEISKRSSKFNQAGGGDNSHQHQDYYKIRSDKKNKIKNGGRGKRGNKVDYDKCLSKG